ncbi:MAG: hypothetical protein ACLQMF_13285 [Rectinemataceae bacterium]
MEFNSFLWDQLKQTEIGKQSIQMFSDLKKWYYEKNTVELVANYGKSPLLKELLYTINPDRMKWICEMYDALVPRFVPKFAGESSTIGDVEKAIGSLWDIIDREEEGIERRTFCVDNIPDLSIALYWCNKNYFPPYYFYRRTQLLKKIFEALEIYFPPIPPKRDMEKRFLYYAELCKSIYEFRLRMNMTPEEMCSLLYFFGPNFVKEDEVFQNKPQMAFFVGGGKKSGEVDDSEDFEFLDKADDNTVDNWQGNASASPNDIVVMYCLTPRSYIHSIWRVKEYGYVDPFFYHYNNTWIHKPIKVPHISYSEIRNDEVLSTMPLVRKNLQGINGDIIEKKYYDRILYLMAQKGFDISVLPKLEALSFSTDIHLVVERDVEQNLLEPLLIKLGYTQMDWVRQLKIKIGRGERIIPDYVLLLNKKKDDYSSYWVWEAKYSIVTDGDLQDAFIQAKSYAQRLSTTGLGIVAKEGIWVTGDVNIDSKKLMFYSWTDLNGERPFQELYHTCRKPTLGVVYDKSPAHKITSSRKDGKK